MRITAVIALFLLALCAPAHALAGTFVVPFGGGTSDARRGLGAASRRACRVRLRGRHGVPERRDARRPRRLPLPLQRARGSADHLRDDDAELRQGERRDGAVCLLLRRTARRHAAALQRRDVHELRLDEPRQLGRARPLQRGRRPDRGRDLPRQQRHLCQRLGDHLGSHAARAVRQRADRGAVRPLRGAAMGGLRPRERSPGRHLCDRRRRARDAARAGLLLALRHRRHRHCGDRPRRARRRRRIRSPSTRSRTPTPLPASDRCPSPWTAALRRRP